MSAPTDDDRLEVLRRFLSGLVRGDDAKQLAIDIGHLHVRNNTFPGEVLMQLSANALAQANLDPQHPVDYRALLSTHLSEISFRGKEHRRIQYAVLTAFAVHGGLEPDLLDEVTYWIEQYWQYALFAAVAIFRACADRGGVPLETFAADLAARHNLDIT
jgi:hypothetical protein